MVDYNSIDVKKYLEIIVELNNRSRDLGTFVSSRANDFAREQMGLEILTKILPEYQKIPSELRILDEKEIRERCIYAVQRVRGEAWSFKPD